jgi:CheY-like chemotaxis protein
MSNGGKLHLQTRNVNLDKSFIRPYKVKTGRYVKVAVKDNGVGMDPQTLRRIFDPFFTTREMGRGTGLGLASAYGIIKNHDGIIEARSRKGTGTTFEFYLPAASQPIVEASEPSEKSPAQVIKGTETILFVDDEEMILQVAEEMLKDLGYKALLAAGGTEALDAYARNIDTIDMVVLDLIMPDMSGQEVYRHLQKLKPDVKVLFSSGYSVSDPTAAILEQGACGFLQKPFDVYQLSLKLRELLGPTR